MPKNTNAAGASYEGHVDTSPEDRSQPEWVPADEAPEADVSRETEPAEEPKRRPGRPKGSKNTTAKAGNAAAEGSTRA